MEKVPVSFIWPKEQYDKINALARELELSFQKFVIMSMKQKINNLANKTENNLNK